MEAEIPEEMRELWEQAQRELSEESQKGHELRAVAIDEWADAPADILTGVVWEGETPLILNTLPAEPEEKVSIIHFDAHGSKGSGLYCDCGAVYIHKRPKVLAAWIAKHSGKTGCQWRG